MMYLTQSTAVSPGGNYPLDNVNSRGLIKNAYFTNGTINNLISNSKITNAYLYAGNINSSGAIITNAAGLYLTSTASATNNTGIYLSDATTTNIPPGKGHALMPLAYVKTYVDKNQHPPEVPSAAEMEKNGLDLGEMNKLLLKKLEEMTLYMIEKDKEIKELQNQVIEIIKAKK